MATYPGMTLGGEIRESISLDDDDLSDVEDEVFIRDGKNGYKFAEDIGVKRPLMAPRRKPYKPDLKSRLKNRPPCRALCKPCCYVFGALLVLIGLIVLVVIIVSMFPLPIDRIKSWILTKTQKNTYSKVLPCSDLKVSDVWTVSFPKYTSESSLRSIDINGDGIDDVVFGFGTGDNSVLHPDIFCPMFVGVASPCGGGVIALNGLNGNVLWQKHLAHTIFTLFCSADLNGDKVFDCIATGKGGTLVALNSINGTILWDFNADSKDTTLVMDMYTANFIPDQDKDGISDIVAAHTSQKERDRSGHLILISGKTGKEIQRISTPNGAETYYIPQLLPQLDGQYQVLFGTGSPNSPGNLSLISLRNLLAGNATFRTIYHDNFKGVLSPSILVDLTGDGQLDIVTAMFNSAVVAFDGVSYKQLWNVTVNNSETLSVPTPAYFNNDNVTDFLVKYQTGPEYPVYYYSQTFIIDGSTGKVIYDKPLVDSVGSQFGGITLAMEGHGFDFYTYWMSDCKFYEGMQDIYEFLPDSTVKEQTNADLCKLRFNSSKVDKLYALNQFEQPPGLELYSSDNRTKLEYNNTKTAIEVAIDYLHKHPEVRVPSEDNSSSQSDNESTYTHKEPLKTVKYKDGSPFRHKSDNQGIIKDYAKPERPKITPQIVEEQKYEPDYDQPSENWQPKVQNYPQNYQPDEIYYNNYLDDTDPFYTNKQTFNGENANNNRDTRGEDNQKSSKRNLSDEKHGVYSYHNVQQSRGRLMNDLNNVPTEILKDNYFKNREQLLQKSRFEQRDVTSHGDRVRENEEVKRVIEEEKKQMLNTSETLWDLESEKEIEDRKNGYWRGKRETVGVKGIPRISPIGVLVKTLSAHKNAVDMIFLTYWTPPKNGPQVMIQQDYECIANKIKNAMNSKEEILNYEKAALEDVFKKECWTERVHSPPTTSTPRPKPNIPYINQISQLSLGQMTVYRIRIECVCNVSKKNEQCAKFLNPSSGWSEYMGKIGDGVFGRF